MGNYVIVLIALWVGVFIGFMIATFFRGAQEKRNPARVQPDPSKKRSFPA